MPWVPSWLDTSGRTLVLTLTLDIAVNLLHESCNLSICGMAYIFLLQIGLQARTIDSYRVRHGRLFSSVIRKKLKERTLAAIAHAAAHGEEAARNCISDG